MFRIALVAATLPLHPTYAGIPMHTHSPRGYCFRAALALAVLMVTGCRNPAETTPVGRFELTTVNGKAVPAIVTSTSPAILESGSLYLDGRNGYEVTLTSRPTGHESGVIEHPRSRGTVRSGATKLEFLLEPTEWDGNFFETLLLEIIPGTSGVRVRTNMGGVLEFEPRR